jgi:uncharacterized protein involved in exopolysaccharide biosynthesis
MHDEIEHLYVEEDEIKLLDLLIVLAKHKMLIIGMVLFCGLAAVVISLFMSNVYRSEATLVARTQEETSFNPLTALGGLGGAMAEGLGLGGGGSLEKLEVVLKSRNLTNRVIKKYNLMPVIFPRDWDEKKKKWTTDDPPTLQDGWKEMQDRLTVRVDIKKNTLKVGFDHEDPKTAKKVVDHYLTELSEILREEVLKDAAENKRFFRKQLEKTIDSLLEEKIYSMLAKEIEKETFARAQKYYSFLVLDPPIVTDPDKQIRPKRALICILAVIVAFFLAVFLAFMKEYVHHLKTEDQERYRKVVQGMSFKKKK